MLPPSRMQPMVADFPRTFNAAGADSVLAVAAVIAADSYIGTKHLHKMKRLLGRLNGKVHIAAVTILPLTPVFAAIDVGTVEIIGMNIVIARLHDEFGKFLGLRERLYLRGFRLELRGHSIHVVVAAIECHDDSGILIGDAGGGIRERAEAASENLGLLHACETATDTGR